MSRRVRQPRAPSVLGEARKDAAVMKLRQWAAKKVLLSVKYRPTVDDMVRINFRDEDVAKLKAAYSLAQSSTPSGRYAGPHANTNLLLNFDGMKMLTPMGDDVLFVQRDRGEEYLEAWEIARKIHVEFCVAEHVLRWLDSNGTAGAMRYYFPAVQALAPDAPALCGEVPSRYSTPYGIGDQVSLIRRAQVTVANALLMPGAVAPANTNVRLAFNSGSANVEGLSISTASQIYNLGAT